MQKGGQEGLQRRFIVIPHCGEVPFNPMSSFVPKQSITKMGCHFCSAPGFLDLNIFMMQKYVFVTPIS
jgi:hypothetical protein